jgi:hypothetical protein
MGIKWQDEIPNNDVLVKADITTVFSMLNLRKLMWLGHTKKIIDDKIPRDLIYGK